MLYFGCVPFFCSVCIGQWVKFFLESKIIVSWQCRLFFSFFLFFWLVIWTLANKHHQGSFGKPILFQAFLCYAWNKSEPRLMPAAVPSWYADVWRLFSCCKTTWRNGIACLGEKKPGKRHHVLRNHLPFAPTWRALVGIRKSQITLTLVYQMWFFPPSFSVLLKLTVMAAHEGLNKPPVVAACLYQQNQGACHILTTAPFRPLTKLWATLTKV